MGRKIMAVRNRLKLDHGFTLDHATDAQIRAKINQTMTRLSKVTKSNEIKVGMAYIAFLNKELERRKENG
jgi:hypothetical protein